MTVWVKEIREDELAPVAMMPQGKWKRYVSLEPDGRRYDLWHGLSRPR